MEDIVERLADDLNRCRIDCINAEEKAQERGRLLGRAQARIRQLEEELVGAKNELALIKFHNTAMSRRLGS